MADNSESDAQQNNGRTSQDNAGSAPGVQVSFKMSS